MGVMGSYKIMAEGQMESWMDGEQALNLPCLVKQNNEY